MVRVSWQEDVTIIHYGPANAAKNKVVKKLTFPQCQSNFEEFVDARLSSGYGGASRFPAGILYAQSVEEVIIAVEYARMNGYQISPRGRGHSYQGMSSMDGEFVFCLRLLILKLTLLCTKTWYPSILCVTS